MMKNPAADLKKELKAIKQVADPAARLAAYQTFKENIDKRGVDQNPRGELAGGAALGGFVGLLGGNIAGYIVGGAAALLLAIPPAFGFCVVALTIAGAVAGATIGGRNAIAETRSKFDSWRYAQKIHTLGAKAGRRIRSLSRHAAGQAFAGVSAKKEPVQAVIVPAPASKTAAPSL